MHYRAFFSYARADDRIANWLHRQLDGYRAPKGLVGTEGELGPVPAKLHPIFRDRTDLESGGHVDTALQAALEASETLIVLCTPTSAKSQWVNHECETFLKLGREGAIFPVIAAGEPESGDPDTECFPPALRGRGLLAADLREIKQPNGQLIGDGREGGRLKLIAGLLGVPLDRLVQRERRRQRQVMAALSAAALVFLGVAAVAGVQTMAANANLTLAKANEKKAKDNAAAERKAREDERTQRERADAETLKAIAAAQEAVRQEGFASENARRALSTLHRFFATQAWTRVERHDNDRASLYAMAGMALAPENAELYREPFAHALHDSAEPAKFSLGERVSFLDFNSDSTQVITGDGDETIWWDAIQSIYGGGIVSAKLGRVGAPLFTLSDDRIVTLSRAGFSVWKAVKDADAGELLFSVDHGVYRPVLSADSNRIATYDQRSAKLWSARDGQPLGGANFALNSTCVFSADLERLATYKDNVVEVWNLRDGSRAAAFTLDAPVRSVAMSPRGDAVVTSSNVEQLWAVSGERPVATLSRRAGLNRARFSPDGAYFLTASDDNLELRRTIDGGLQANLGKQRNMLNEAVFSRDGRRVITYPKGNAATLWDVDATRPVATLQMDDEITLVVLSMNSDRVAVGARGTTKVWDARDGRWLATVREYAGRAAFNADGSLLAIAGEKNVAVWDLQKLTRTWDSLAREFCATPVRRFSQADIEGDPLLSAEWSASRDVCAPTYRSNATREARRGT